LYLAKHKEDYDALFTFGDSRSHVETSNGRHLIEAMHIFQQLHNERPDDIAASHKLLELYDQIGYLPEATRIADQVLDQAPKDAAALRTKAAALTRSNKVTEALVVSQTLNEAAPLDLDGQLLTWKLMRMMKYPANDIIAHYAALREKYPDDPRFELLL